MGNAKIGVIGLGYVGLPLAVEFVKAGFEVTGFDIDVSKVDGFVRIRKPIKTHWNIENATSQNEKIKIEDF